MCGKFEFMLLCFLFGKLGCILQSYIQYRRDAQSSSLGAELTKGDMQD